VAAAVVAVAATAVVAVAATVVAAAVAFSAAAFTALVKFFIGSWIILTSSKSKRINKRIFRLKNIKEYIF